MRGEGEERRRGGHEGVRVRGIVSIGALFVFI